jgi:hypothetical protein
MPPKMPLAPPESPSHSQSCLDFRSSTPGCSNGKSTRVRAGWRYRAGEPRDDVLKKRRVADATSQGADAEARVEVERRHRRIPPERRLVPNNSACRRMPADRAPDIRSGRQGCRPDCEARPRAARRPPAVNCGFLGDRVTPFSREVVTQAHSYSGDVVRACLVAPAFCNRSTIGSDERAGGSPAETRDPDLQVISRRADGWALGRSWSLKGH